MAPPLRLSLTLLPGVFAIARYALGQKIPGPPPDGRFYSVTRTDEECSVVCEESLLAAGARAERGRSLLRVDGTLDFSLTGVLAALAAPLAQAKISIFALSTYDTDYLLLAQNDLDRAIAALERAGHSVKRSLNR